MKSEKMKSACVPIEWFDFLGLEQAGFLAYLFLLEGKKGEAFDIPHDERSLNRDLQISPRKQKALLWELEGVYIIHVLQKNPDDATSSIQIIIRHDMIENFVGGMKSVREGREEGITSEGDIKW